MIKTKLMSAIEAEDTVTIEEVSKGFEQAVESDTVAETENYVFTPTEEGTVVATDKESGESTAITEGEDEMLQLEAIVEEKEIEESQEEVKEEEGKEFSETKKFSEEDILAKLEVLEGKLAELEAKLSEKKDEVAANPDELKDEEKTESRKFSTKPITAVASSSAESKVVSSVINLFN